ncbi:dihydroorotase [Saccharothrix algeriensis]|uniref:Dihydroorotase n=1 Tax=Saccharothrix algeriensis TaxID=173560 RepID=A0ABS2S2J8_9PSEU|nr:dihydroorotase family protein [Saccharothrix algeriensis]MBM7810467.1 dihydroorotase [Saccharothrix algeriensis]
MTRYDVLVRGGTVVTPKGTTAADVAMAGGVVSALLRPGTDAVADRVVDARRRFVLPGLIDSHVHFRTPGLAHKETWTTGSRAAVAGGITTVVDMPNTKPPLVTPADAAAKHRDITGTSLVDYRFHAGVDPRRLEAVLDLSPRDAVTVKVFLCGHHTAPDVLRDPADLERLFRLAARAGLVLVCHAEDEATFALLDAWHGAPERSVHYEPRRPRTAAIIAVARLVELARRHGTRVHILHVSSREEVDLLIAAADAGIPVTFEVTAHHLTFTDADTVRVGTRLWLRPAIRDEADRDRLWRAVVDGHAFTVGSDHAPHTVVEKSLPGAEAPPGLPGVQELLPALWTGLRRHFGLSVHGALAVVRRVLAENPARLCGLVRRKGSVEVGKDADLVVFDPSRTRTFTSAEVHALCGWSAYEGRELDGGVDVVLRRGEVVHEHGRFGSPSGVWLDAAAPV